MRSCLWMPTESAPPLRPPHERTSWVGLGLGLGLANPNPNPNPNSNPNTNPNLGHHEHALGGLMAPHEQLHERELALPLRVEDGQQLVPLAQLGLQRVAECLRHQPAAAAGRRLRLDVSVDLPEEG